MRRRRALVSSSSAQSWWQNSSDSQRAAGSAPTAVCFAIVNLESIADLVPKNLITSGNVGTTQQYTTIILTRTEYTTYIYSNSRSSRSQESTRSSLSSMSSQSTSKTYRHTTSTSSSSWSPSFVYHPTTLSTTTTSSVTTHSTTTVGTVIYMTSTHTVPTDTSIPTRVPTSAIQDTTSATSTSAASSTSGATGSNGDKDHGSLLVSPAGSSRHSAAIAGGMTSSLAGIALIGLLFLFLFRKRKRSLPYHEKDGTAAEPRMSSSSQALPSAVAAAGAARHSDRSANLAPQRSRPDRLPVIDHNLIHMNVEHWDRPFAHEDPRLRDDGSPLRLMNPDPTPTPPVFFRSSSTSMSPDTTSGNPHGFLQRQRSALSAALLSIKRSFSSQDVVPRNASGESYLQPSAHPSAHPSPLHIQNKDTNKLTMPSEAILAGITVSRPISSQSAMSKNTIIRHQVPDDPFITSTSATPNSLLPSCPHYGNGIARRDFLAPPPLRTRMPVQSTPTHPQHGTVSPITRSNSDCSTRFESLSPTRSEISSVSVRSGPFDLATASVVDMESGRETSGFRGQREQTPNWEIHVNPGT
jgi:hypothetical protein